MPGIDFYKKFTGKIKKITEKKIKMGEKFFTPGCDVMIVPEGTVYYEIVLEKESILENRRGSPDVEKVEKEAGLVFFEFWNNKDLDGKNLLVGKKYIFFTEGSCWISNWQKFIE